MIALMLVGCALLEVENVSTPTLEVLVEEGAVLENPVSLLARVTDDGDALSQVAVRFTSDVDGEVCSVVPGVDGSVVCERTLSVGLHVLEIDARDPDDRGDSLTVMVEVAGLQADTDADTGADTDTGSP